MISNCQQILIINTIFFSFFASVSRIKTLFQTFSDIEQILCLLQELEEVAFLTALTSGSFGTVFEKSQYHLLIWFWAGCSQAEYSTY